MSQFDVDLFVIGAGSGGVRAARMAAATGAKVIVAEAKYLGGTCVNVGCVPKKLFYYGAHFASDFNDAKNYGWEISPPKFKWNTLRDNKTAEITRLNGIYDNLLTNANVEIINGFATLVDAHHVEVNGKLYNTNKILLATGCTPFIPTFKGSEYAISSDDIFYLEMLPKKMLVVGGGYIALEFAGILTGLGVDVTLSYRGNQLLKNFDHSLGQHLAIEMQNHGIDVRLDSHLEAIEKTSEESFQVNFSDGSQEHYGQVLYATGRSPLTNNIGLENTEVKQRANGKIVVDEYFQTDEESIFALGDIIGTPELTPVALAQGMAFVDTWFKSTPRKVDYEHIATAVFSLPNIGTVGLTESEAKNKYVNVDVYESEFRHLKHTISGNTERTYMKLIVDAKTDKVIGCHMMGQDAGEILQGIAVALKAGATKSTFDTTIGIHPTAAEEFVTMRTSSRTHSE